MAEDAAAECQRLSAGTSTAPPEHWAPSGQGKQPSAGRPTVVDSAKVPPRHLQRGGVKGIG